jgi:nucleoside-diphosphate-sugar epimerase
MARRAPLNAIYVEDVAHAALQASMSGGDDFSVYNINSLGDQHFGDFLNALRSELHGPRITLFVPRAVLRILAWKYGSLRILLSRVRFDASKAAQELGFVPQYDLSSMVRDIIRRTREAVLSV